ncbi:hypothetical protein HX792_07885 [Pseudomonas sp. B6002]|uniref:hypothetical protein n=1 Tax=Pseudomonas sp. B6002 TaxID=2726978 RepID=UPI0015A281F5|nr:hypothetical protein [Pseudomonas sp. B6002]NVZ50249.1 hypothetical protein [Pseudomonas sp. B6002]
MAEEELTAEAKKQRRKREKEAARNAALAVEKFTVEVAGVFKADLKRLMKQHGFNNQQEVFQNLLRNVIAADFETARLMLKCVTTPYEPSEKVSRAFYEKSMVELGTDPGDEYVHPGRHYQN